MIVFIQRYESTQMFPFPFSFSISFSHNSNILLLAIVLFEVESFWVYSVVLPDL